MKSFIKNIIPAVALLFAAGFTSCTSDLDVTPLDPNLNTNIGNGDDLLRKCYANLSLAGQSGPDGNDCDIDGLDGGTTGLIRQLWNTNELPTDEAICNWGDPGIGDYNFASYGSSHPMAQGLYYRLYTGVTFCNQYLDNFTEDAQKVAQVRFLRALYYYLLMDAYGNVPFTEHISAEMAPQIQRADLFKWLEAELTAVEPDLADAKAKTDADADYGTVDKAAVWMLLSRMYLNAEVYTGQAQWAKAAEYAKKVIDSPYKLYTGAAKNGWTAYQQLFMGDNGSNGASVEFVFPVLSDGKTTAAYGNTEFIIASTFDKGVICNPDGATAGNNTSENWAGNRARKSLVDKFFPKDDAPHVHAYAMADAAGDDRALLDGLDADGKERNVTQANAVQVNTFVNGFAIGKFNNFYSTGGAAHDSKFCDTDFPLFRVAEAYLTYAEATARQNGGTTTTEGTKYINDLRARAHASQRTSGNYSLDDILDEWSREFYFEARRRVDLVRFNKFGGNVNYNWPWKGGVLAGTNFAATKNVYAIPANDMSSNPNLVQNPGY